MGAPPHSPPTSRPLEPMSLRRRRTSWRRLGRNSCSRRPDVRLSRPRSPSLSPSTASRASADVGQPVTFRPPFRGRPASTPIAWTGLPSSCPSVDSTSIDLQPASPGPMSVAARLTYSPVRPSPPARPPSRSQRIRPLQAPCPRSARARGRQRDVHRREHPGLGRSLLHMARALGRLLLRRRVAPVGPVRDGRRELLDVGRPGRLGTASKRTGRPSTSASRAANGIPSRRRQPILRRPRPTSGRTWASG